MFAVFRKIVFASVLVLTVLATGAWQGSSGALAQSQGPGTEGAPLYPGLTWSSLGATTQTVRINGNGDTISLPGERFEAREQFMSVLPQDITNYYSNEQLAKSGWVSYDSFDGPGGAHYVYSHESGAYLSVEFLTCPADPSSICLAVWQSEPVDPAAATPGNTSEPVPPADKATFSKTTPANGAINVNPNDVVLSWQAASPTPEKYSYCVKEGSACPDNDPNWTSTFDLDRSVTVDLANNKTYYWQVRSTTCASCVPKPWVYANDGTPWTFKTQIGGQVTILGNAGVGGAVLSYTDGTPKTVTADSTGAYSIRVPANWSGTITPSKSGYFFTPRNASFTNLTAGQTIQNFTAIVAYVISGNVGVAGATLSYVETTPRTVTSDVSGNYSISVPSGWTGTVTPAHPCYNFTPANRSYTNVTANQPSQNYTATFNNAPACKVTTGVFRPSNGALYLKNTNVTGFADVQINYGQSGDYPVVGDWDGDGDATIGIYRNGFFHLRNSNTIGAGDIIFAFGSPGDQPIAGDWDGDGIDTVGVYRSSIGTFFLRNTNSSGAPDVSFALGVPGDVAIAGDWNGNNEDTTGVFRPSNGALYLKNANTTGVADIQINYGLPGDKPVVGDWDGDGDDTIGIFRNGFFHLRNANTVGVADLIFALGVAGDMPISGNWDGLP